MQPPGIGLEAIVETLPDAVARESRAFHQVEDDALVGRPPQVVALDVSRRPVDLHEGRRKGATPRPARRQDGAVDVEEDETHGGAHRGAGSARARKRATMGGRHWTTASTPMPTTAARFSVPDRYPPSCPPPRRMGARRTPMRTQSAPAPGGP